MVMDGVLWPRLRKIVAQSQLGVEVRDSSVISLRTDTLPWTEAVVKSAPSKFETRSDHFQTTRLLTTQGTFCFSCLLHFPFLSAPAAGV